MINEDLLLDSLFKFYNNSHNGARLVSILKGETNTSLRSVDWFITNYSKKNNIYYNIYKTKNNTPSFSEKDNQLVCNLNVFQSYKSQLRAYSKKRFDPFCRRNRIKYNCQGEILDTTIGQLNFFKWAINNLIMDYIKIHKDNIELDMNTCLKEMKLSGSLMKKEGKRKKRQELSLSATRGLSRNNVLVHLDFD
jgi:hypothetical protein